MLVLLDKDDDVYLVELIGNDFWNIHKLDIKDPSSITHYIERRIYKRGSVSEIQPNFEVKLDMPFLVKKGGYESVVADQVFHYKGFILTVNSNDGIIYILNFDNLSPLSIITL